MTMLDDLIQLCHCDKSYSPKKHGAD